MSGVASHTVTAEDADVRLDRWFRRLAPQLSHGRLEKLLRTGQVRVDGKRAKASQRLQAGQVVRVPPLGEPATADAPARPQPALTAAEIAEVRGWVLHRDADVIAIAKPAGLAVQGGTGTTRHLDAMLEALQFDAAERPRLVHRLDKDTSGVLLLARSAPAARALTASFRARDAEKLYWAIVVRGPDREVGTIDLALRKKTGRAGEQMEVDPEGGQRAITDMRVVDRAGKRAAWLALWPRTGRTHQLRVHCAAVGAPILGDGKYGGADAFITGADIAHRLHLHARRIDIAHPAGGRLAVTAPLPEDLRVTWQFFGFDEADFDRMEVDDD
ncbi:MAG: RluA family pseudouridine synthase [Alphaproteobacteria bacterium]